MQLPKSVKKQLREKVDLQKFSSPVCKVMTEFLAPVLFIEEVLLQYATHLQDDHIARVDRFSSEDEFACSTIYDEEEILDKMLDKAVERAVAQVCTSDGMKQLVHTSTPDVESVEEKKTPFVGFWHAIADMPSLNLALLLGATIIPCFLIVGGVNIEDLKDFLRIIFGAESSPLNGVIEPATIH